MRSLGYTIGWLYCLTLVGSRMGFRRTFAAGRRMWQAMKRAESAEDAAQAVVRCAEEIGIPNPVQAGWVMRDIWAEAHGREV